VPAPRESAGFLEGAAEVGYDQADFFPGDFGRKRFFYGAKAVVAEAVGGGFDLSTVVLGDPLGVEFDGASFHKIGDEADHSGDAAVAETGDLVERRTLREQAQRFFGGVFFSCFISVSAGALEELLEGG